VGFLLASVFAVLAGLKIAETIMYSDEMKAIGYVYITSVSSSTVFPLS